VTVGGYVWGVFATFLAKYVGLRVLFWQTSQFPSIKAPI